jgi:hypothetical protein
MKTTSGHLHCLHAIILATVDIGAVWWCAPIRSVKLWLLLLSIHKTYSRRDWKKKEPSSESSFFMDRELGAIWPLSTFSHGMVHRPLVLCSSDPYAIMNSVVAGCVIIQRFNENISIGFIRLRTGTRKRLLST